MKSFNKTLITKELVIGCYNYKFPKLDTNKGGILYFIKSLRKYNSRCTIIIFMDTCPLEIKHFLNENNVLFLTGFKENLMYSRFIKYYEIIFHNKIIEKILMSDINDVIFQENPFDINLESHKLYLASEINNYSDKNNTSSELNMNWIKNGYSLINNLNNFKLADVSAEDNYFNKNIICAGTILGDRYSIINYLEWYKKTQIKCNMLCNDQGLLNIYVYENKDIENTIINYNNSQILTLDRINLDTINKDNNGYLLNKDGNKYIIIHQIDRCGSKNLQYFKKLINM